MLKRLVQLISTLDRCVFHTKKKRKEETNEKANNLYNNHRCISNIIKGLNWSTSQYTGQLIAYRRNNKIDK